MMKLTRSHAVLTGFGLASDWLRTGFGLASDWLWTGFGLAVLALEPPPLKACFKFETLAWTRRNSSRFNLLTRDPIDPQAVQQFPTPTILKGFRPCR